MSLPTNGGTDRDAIGSVSALTAHPYSSSYRPPPSYFIPRSAIVASSSLSVNGPSRKRSLSGDSLTAPTVVGSSRISFTEPHASLSASSSALNRTYIPTLENMSAASPLTCVLAVPPKKKRLRREPRSPTSVGEVSDSKRMPPAKTASTTATSPGAAQMQSMLRGLQHLSTCNSSGCANPLCVSTHAFVEKVRVHRSSMAGKGNHDGNRCGACKLWTAIVQAHAPTCNASGACCVPGCSPRL